MQKQGKSGRTKQPKPKQRRPTQKEKTLRAFGAYLEVLDTAAYLKQWMQGPLASFDLTMQGFRLLVLLYRDGPTPMVKAAKEMRFARQNLEFIVVRLEERGWVRRENMRMETARADTRVNRKLRRIGLRPAWQVGIIQLTPSGEEFVAEVFPRQAKVVKALMRALDGREQERLREICRKLRAGHILKFMSELTHADEWEQEYEDYEFERLLRRQKRERAAEAGDAVALEEAKDAEEAAKETARPESQPWMQPGVKQQPVMRYEIEEWLRWEAEQDKMREAEYRREHPEYRDGD